LPPQRHDLTATGPSTASDPARLLNPKRTTDVLPKPDNCKSYRHEACTKKGCRQHIGRELLLKTSHAQPGVDLHRPVPRGAPCSSASMRVDVRRGGHARVSLRRANRNMAQIFMGELRVGLPQFLIAVGRRSPRGEAGESHLKLCLPSPVRVARKVLMDSRLTSFFCPRRKGSRRGKK